MAKNYWLALAKRRKAYSLHACAITKGGTYEEYGVSDVSLEELFEMLDLIKSETDNNGGYMSFADADGVYPTDDNEVVVVIKHRGRVIIPKGAGGNWPEWDNHLAKR